MAETVNSKNSENLSIHVVFAENLRGTHGEVLTTGVKVEFCDKTYGESGKCESREKKTEFNFSVNIACPLDDIPFMTEMANRPIILTFTEYLPKEKKQKEEKTQILGQAVMDLLSFVKGPNRESIYLPIHAYPGSPLESSAPDSSPPTVSLQVNLGRGLLPESQISRSNMLSVTVESLFSPPDAFSVNGPPGVYTVALPVPFVDNKEQSSIFTGGTVKSASDKEGQGKQKRWHQQGSCLGNAVYIPNNFVSSNQSMDDEDGELKGKEFRDHRNSSENDKARVVWMQEKRHFLPDTAVKNFQDKIAQSRVWPVEVFRLASAPVAKGKKESEENYYGFHGVAYVNLSPLLYPGVKRIRGAYPIYPYLENDYEEKTKRKGGGIGEEAAKVAYAIVNRNTAPPAGKKAGAADKNPPPADKKDKANSDKKKTGSEVEGSAKTPAVGDPSLNEGVPGAPGVVASVQQINVEGQQYQDAKAYIMLEIQLDRPLIPKREKEEIAASVATYIPPRPLLGKRTNHADKAVEDYKRQVADIAVHLIDEFRLLFGEEIRNAGNTCTPETVEQMRQEFMFQLNTSGKYFAFKEQLKYSVIKIVREKCLRTSSFSDQEQLQMFLRDLFVYLVDELQGGLSRVITLQDRTPVPPPQTDSQQILHFAQEAEWNENVELASHYHQERLARCIDPIGEPFTAAAAWLDYGVHCMANNDLSKAEECFREAVSIEQRHTEALLLYGMSCSLQNRKEEAETFLEAATAYDSKNLIPWTILGLHYHSIGNEIGMDMAIQEAHRLSAKQVGVVGQQPRLSLVPGDAGTQNYSSRTEANESLNNLQVETASSASLGPNPGQLAPIAAIIESQEWTSEGLSEESAVSLLERSLMGKNSRGQNVNEEMPVNVNQSEQATSVSSISKSKGSDSPVEPARSIYIQTAQFLIRLKVIPFLDRALSQQLLHLRANKGGECDWEYHHCYAQLRLLQKDYAAAEYNLMEALPLAPANANIWADLGHLKYVIHDQEAARECYERCLCFQTEPGEMHPVLMRLASIYLQAARYEDAKRTFLLACKRNPTCISWLGVGISCYRLHELSEAEDALSEANILNNKDPEVWAYLCLICLKTQRKMEAEQSYKYAMKIGLDDPLMIDEIHQLQKQVGFGNPEI